MAIVMHSITCTIVMCIAVHPSWFFSRSGNWLESFLDSFETTHHFSLSMFVLGLSTHPSYLTHAAAVSCSILTNDHAYFSIPGISF